MALNPVRAAINWGHVGLRAALWGTISVTAGGARDGALSRFCMRQWCIGSSKGLGMRRELRNGHLLEPDRQVVYVANHLSLLDILLLGSFLEADYRWLSKEAIFRVPFLGWHLKKSGHVPVFRGERRELNKKLPERIHAVVEQGASLLFFPEGTRSADGKLRPFKIGAFRTAVDEGLPVQPLVIRGTGRLMSKGALDLDIDSSKLCSVTVLPVIEASDAIDDLDRRATLLRDVTWEAFAAELGVRAGEERDASDDPSASAEEPQPEA